MPAVVLAAEPFEKLLKVVLRARQMSATLAVLIRGNPEYLDQPAQTVLADQVLDEAVHRLTTGAASGKGLIG